ncbi:MAG TPA: DUF4383 domain-containing protein [Longimicrobium sp.]|nr:DUF4383 domain-containing protein [Longimicrobium sp.]
MRPTLVQRAAMLFGVVFLLVGIAGFFVDGGTGMEADPETAGHLLGLFPVNLLHNIVHLLFGLWGLAASRGHSASVGFHRAGALIYVLLTVLGFVAPDGFGLVPLGDNDIWLHAVLALAMAYFGFMHRDRVVDTARV